jgi:hypothetical protein
MDFSNNQNQGIATDANIIEAANAGRFGDNRCPAPR